MVKSIKLVQPDENPSRNVEFEKSDGWLSSAKFGRDVEIIREVHFSTIMWFFRKLADGEQKLYSEKRLSLLRKPKDFFALS